MELGFDYEQRMEKLVRLPKSVRLGGIAALLVAGLIGYGFFLYQPQAVEVSQRLEHAKALQRKLASVRAVAANLAEFEAEVDALQVDFKRALRQLPDSKQFDDLLRDISTAGKQVGVTIKSIEREPEVPHDFYAEVPFQLKVEGSYHDMARFFERVGILPRIVNVGEFEVEVLDESQAGTILRAEGTATTFRFLGEKASV
ncbi:MAG: hypothetical protein CL917_02690 [Deltaproteobacteria bacterium]|nr:hypothetical protein [Deltaproteobacteria bacterium]